MASYVVLEAPPGLTKAAEPAFVRDGFCWPAFIVPPLWLAWHRLWWSALIALAAIVVLAMAGELAGFGPAASLLSLLVSLFVGLEGRNLRVAGLQRRGWRVAAVAEADHRTDAELRYFTATDSAGEAYQPSARAARGSGPVLGLLGYSGKA